MSLVWTWPKSRIYFRGLYDHGNISAMIKEREEGIGDDVTVEGIRDRKAVLD
jgi:hypothetical protein